MHVREDPKVMPGTGESPGQRLAKARPLAGTLGQAYLERRGIPLAVAEAADLRFDPDFAGRPALLVAMRTAQGDLASVHGRYLVKTPRQDKMMTFGQGGGLVVVQGGWQRDPVILVEGLFDALSLAVCGWGSAATIGRWSPWLPEALCGRRARLGFDNGRSGECQALWFASRLSRTETQRLLPPPRCKDWNTALLKLGTDRVRRWVSRQLAEG